MCEATIYFQLHTWQKQYSRILEGLVNDRGRRILIHGPPQFGKSVILSQRFPAYVLGSDPYHRVALCCYNLSRAMDHGHVVRSIMLSSEYEHLFPDTRCRIPKHGSAETFSTVGRRDIFDGQDSFTALGMLTGFVGRGMDTLVVDDPYASAEEAWSQLINERIWRWWTQTVKVRVHDDTNIVVMFHRYHDADFGAKLQEEGNWEYIRFPAIMDANEDGDDITGRAEGELLSPIRSRTFLEDIKDRDPKTFQGLFQGKPRPDEGAFFNRDWFEIVDINNWPDFERYFRYWDLAASVKETGDYTAGSKVTVDKTGALWIADVRRFREEWPEARQLIAETAGHDGPGTWTAVEEVSMQLALSQDLKRLPVFLTHPFTSLRIKGDKKQRASGWAARGRWTGIKLLKGPWNQRFIEECLRFDGTGITHDDQVDATSGAFHLVYYLNGAEHVEPEPVKNTSLAYFRGLRQLFADPDSQGEEEEADDY